MSLEDQYEVRRDDEKLIQTTAEAAQERRRLFEADRAGDPAWSPSPRLPWPARPRPGQPSGTLA